MSPVLLYSPSQSPWASFAAPLKVTVRQQGGEVEGRVQVKLGSSSKSLVFQLKKNQPVVGGSIELTPTLAFRKDLYSLRLTSHSSLNLMQSLGNICYVFPPVQQNVNILWNFSWVNLFVHRTSVSFLPNEKFKPSHFVTLIISSRPSAREFNGWGKKIFRNMLKSLDVKKVYNWSSPGFIFGENDALPSNSSLTTALNTIDWFHLPSFASWYNHWRKSASM